MKQDIKQASSSVTVETLLTHLANTRASGCLQISCEAFSSVSFFIYLWEGKLYYATNSLAPFERLDRHLRRLSHHNTRLNGKVIKQVKQQIRHNGAKERKLSPDYRGILWLKQEYLQLSEVVTLLRRLLREIFEALLCLPQPLIYKFVEQSQPWIEPCSFDLISYTEQCRQRLQAWQIFTTHIQSTYQRLYLASETIDRIPNLTTEQNNTIVKLLKGLNFRQISASIDRDELIVARLLYPGIIDGSVIVRNPKPPFERLPKLPVSDIFENIRDNSEDWLETSSQSNYNANGKDTIQILEKQWRVACVDDSTAIQVKVREILAHHLFAIAQITQPMNALSELMEFKPNLILLEIDMPQISGYELCGLLRNHLEFKSIPIVMLTGERGLVNLTKSKLVGATDYLVKPFDRSSLFNVIFKYLQ